MFSFNLQKGDKKWGRHLKKKFQPPPIFPKTKYLLAHCFDSSKSTSWWKGYVDKWLNGTKRSQSRKIYMGKKRSHVGQKGAYIRLCCMPVKLVIYLTLNQKEIHRVTNYHLPFTKSIYDNIKILISPCF